MSSTPAAAPKSEMRLPSDQTMQNAANLAITQDRPIMLDYWTHSLEKTCLIGVKENKERLLVKNEEEYTSPIVKLFKVNNEYIIMTENSIYIVDTGVPTKKISNGGP